MLILLAGPLLAPATQAEDGYDLWLRYVKVQNPSLLARYRKEVTQIAVPGSSSTAQATRDELQRALSGLLDRKVPLAGPAMPAGTVLVSAPDASPEEVASVQGDGYRLLTRSLRGKTITVIAAKTPLGGCTGPLVFCG